MIRLLQITLFFLSFTIEVQVEAKWTPLLSQSTIVQYPPNCVEICGYKTYPSRKFTLELENKWITLGSDTIILKKSTDHFAFVSGEALLHGEFRIELPVGELQTDSEDSLIYITKVDESFLVRTLFGNVKLTAKGAKDIVQIPQGYENKVHGVSKRGFAEVGFPTSIDIVDMIYKWAHLYDGEKEKFAKDVQYFKEVHTRAVAEVARTYKEVSGRMIASHQDWLEKERIRKEKERRERASLQKLFERKIMGLE